MSARLLLAAAALCAPSVAFAQAAAPAAPVVQAAPADPARLAAAQSVVAQLLPEGIYRKMMGQSFDTLMDSMIDQAGNMPLEQVVRMSGVEAEKAATLGDAKLREVMEIYDPHWSQRMKLGTDAMMGGMTELMSEMEPKVREALARAYAREFTPVELGEMQRFFATPAGRHYAEKSMMLFMDPEIMSAMTEMMPAMMERMPDMAIKAEAATKALPEPRTNSQLTPAERAKLAKLFGVEAKTLEVDAPLAEVDALDTAAEAAAEVE